MLSVLSMKTRIVSLLRHGPAAGFSRTASRMKTYGLPTHLGGLAGHEPCSPFPRQLQYACRVTLRPLFRATVLQGPGCAAPGSYDYWATLGMGS